MLLIGAPSKSSFDIANRNSLLNSRNKFLNRSSTFNSLSVLAVSQQHYQTTIQRSPRLKVHCSTIQFANYQYTPPLSSTYLGQPHVLPRSLLWTSRAEQSRAVCLKQYRILSQHCHHTQHQFCVVLCAYVVIAGLLAGWKRRVGGGEFNPTKCCCVVAAVINCRDNISGYYELDG